MMAGFRRLASVTALGAVIGAAFLAPAEALVRQDVTVNGLQVYRYVWLDSKGLRRSVSLKKEGNGNPGHGGYAVQMTYKYVKNGVTSSVTVNAPAGDGFGYFVSHERYRSFADGDSNTIAGKIFRKDDSPLGRGFPVTTRLVPTGAQKGVIQFGLTYPRYGTKAASKLNQDTGEDDPPLGTAPALYQLYNLPVLVTWYFQDGKDYPRVLTRVDMSSVPGPNRVSFDVRGPYGKLNFDVGSNPIKQVLWGDRFHFWTTTTPLTRNAAWVWNRPNRGARYNSLIAGIYEMGLVEPLVFARSALNDGYADGRGKTSATYFNGNGCPFQAQKIPCDYEWAYQSSQYELPYNDPNGTTTSEKMAWGSTPYYGMDLPSTYDGTTSTPFTGFPANKIIQYQVCIVLGPAVVGGLTRSIALDGQGYSCADTSAN